MFQELRAGLLLLVLSILLTGIAYPLAMNKIGASLFPHQASGSLAEKNGNIIGSELIGQNFAGVQYFRARPSAAGDGYDASNSAGSNLAPSDANLVKTITQRVNEWHKNDDTRAIPIDLVTASASGLDPDISVAAALYQAPYIAQARNIPLLQIQNLITAHTVPRILGLLGEKHVNVLVLNRSLDEPSVTAAP